MDRYWTCGETLCSNNISVCQITNLLFIQSFLVSEPQIISVLLLRYCSSLLLHSDLCCHFCITLAFPLVPLVSKRFKRMYLVYS